MPQAVVSVTGCLACGLFWLVLAGCSFRGPAVEASGYRTGPLGDSASGPNVGSLIERLTRGSADDDRGQPNLWLERARGLVAAEDAATHETGERDDAATARLAAADSVALARLIQDLGAEIGDWSRGAELAIAIVSEQWRYGYRSDESINSASAVKAVWLVAAADLAGVDAAEPYARAAIEDSSNAAAGSLIDLVGLDRINEYTQTLGLAETWQRTWFFGRSRRSTNAGGSGNKTSARDLADFYLMLGADGSPLSDLVRDEPELQAWLRAAPDDRTGAGIWGGVLTDRLPAEVADRVMHKAGWLPPGCCGPGDNDLLSAGWIPLSDGGGFAVAVSTSGGANYGNQGDFIGYAVCEIYEVVAGVDLQCLRVGDPIEAPARAAAEAPADGDS